MMREILFRGKTEYSGRWVQGDLYKSSKSVFIMANNADSYAKTNYAVHPETVGQYTGLTDKNGTKIFEGDIVEGLDYDEECGFGVVYWDDGAFFVGNDSWCGTFCENYNGKNFEVIGNIHDNPELIGGADNG